MTNKIITKFDDNSHLEYAQGSFDNWCIYYVGINYRFAIKDLDTFIQLRKCTLFVPAKLLYQDFVGIYCKTTSSFESEILDQIKLVSKSYPNCSASLEYILSFLYAAMVAEENKHRAILKKRIKRLAIHQLLIENLSPEVTANFSRGKKWRWLDQECKRRGF
jgi:hypothetical protein